MFYQLQKSYEWRCNYDLDTENNLKVNAFNIKKISVADENSQIITKRGFFMIKSNHSKKSNNVFSSQIRRLKKNSLNIAIGNLKGTLKALDNIIDTFSYQQTKDFLSKSNYNINFTETVESFLAQIESVLDNASEQTSKVCVLLEEQKSLSPKETAEFNRIIIDLVKQYNNIDIKLQRFNSVLSSSVEIARKKRRLDSQFDALKNNIITYNKRKTQTKMITISEATKQQKIEEKNL